MNGVVGDGEAETGPLATSWHSNKFLNPVRDGAVLPILHLNGYKINNPTLLARIPIRKLEALFVGYGWTPYFVEGADPESCTSAMAATLDAASAEIRRSSGSARTGQESERPRWPMIVLRQPEGMDRTEGSGRAQGRRISGARTRCRYLNVQENPEHLAQLEEWMRSYKPEELFDEERSTDSGTAVRLSASGRSADER